MRIKKDDPLQDRLTEPRNHLIAYFEAAFLEDAFFA